MTLPGSLQSDQIVRIDFGGSFLKKKSGVPSRKNCDTLLPQKKSYVLIYYTFLATFSQTHLATLT
jgi:hypothetical protein